jgi:hypothetical protein
LDREEGGIGGNSNMTDKQVRFDDDDCTIVAFETIHMHDLDNELYVRIDMFV